MAGSLVATVKAAVIDGLATHLEETPGFNAADPENEVLVEYGYSFKVNAAQRIYVGRARADTPPAHLKAGRNVRKEQGTFQLVVRVEKPGGNVQEADDRVDAIGTEVETWLADRKSDQLGIGLTALYVTGWDQNYAGTDSCVVSIREYTVRWTAERR